MSRGSLSIVVAEVDINLIDGHGLRVRRIRDRRDVAEVDINLIDGHVLVFPLRDETVASQRLIST